TNQDEPTQPPSENVQREQTNTEEDWDSSPPETLPSAPLESIAQPPVDAPAIPMGELGTENKKNINQEEAMKMLQAIRDRDLSRRIQKQNETQRRYRPADRDW
ncbi:hypothetical protein N9B60_03105, partial [Mariniblastus sp.]|nr:hypothetical protein [Mariniblastus sp.]